MQIERHEIETSKIEAFAEKHGLIMEIHERRRPEGDPGRYYAHFKGAEEMIAGGCLKGSFGNGRTPELAIEDYASEISLRRLAIDAMKPTRREIQVPRLI